MIYPVCLVFPPPVIELVGLPEHGVKYDLPSLTARILWVVCAVFLALLRILRGLQLLIC